ncbi:hypothetical protein KQI74_17525 [Paenibacillus barcinonensis]|uniref:S41 family peptidase n=1 Tax=Paenibacillus barcinonensis TaxID=198119 RepID=UPI001C10848C|nr:S41 family peptidase [Paenibacillus barcinonensis]MBU5354091.1 hypothetical protein [Paenibacillus barcinonensis]
MNRALRYIRRIKVACSMLCILMLLSACSNATNGLTMNWRPDLELILEQFPEKEIGLSSDSQRAEHFEKQVSSILSNLNSYGSDDEVKMELFKAIASIHQLHTHIDLDDREQVLPFHFFYQEGNMYVNGVHPQYKDVMYGKLIKVQDTSIEDVMKALEQVIAYDNVYGLQHNLPLYLLYPSVLHGLGIIDNKDEIKLTFQKKDSTIIEYAVTPVEQPNYLPQMLARRTFSFNQTNLNLNYDVQYLPSDRALYLPYRMCAEDKSYPIAAFEQNVLKTLHSNKVEKLIIDLRNNPGGASWVLDPLIDKLEEVPALTGKVFVLINQGTASSALLNAYTMKQKLQATLVGSPTQSSPNKPGEVKIFKLPESGLNISYSTKEFHLVEEETDSLYPDIRVDLTITDYEEDVDRVVQTVLSLNQ